MAIDRIWIGATAAVDAAPSISASSSGASLVPSPAASPSPSSSSAPLRAAAAAVGRSPLFAVVADPAGSDPSFAATSLDASGSWAAGLQSGSFDYAYPITASPSTGDETPELSLTSSSYRADGYVVNENGQASQVGLGWELPIPFIERTLGRLHRQQRGQQVLDGAERHDQHRRQERDIDPDHREKDALRNVLPASSFAMNRDQGYRIERVHGCGRS